MHVRTSRVMVPDLKNGWNDCVQIWYTDRDRLVGCRASQLEAHPHSSARAGLHLSLTRSLVAPNGVLLVLFIIDIINKIIDIGFTLSFTTI